MHERFNGAGVAGAEFYAGARIGPAIIENKLAVFVVHVKIDVFGKLVAPNKNDVIEAFGDWDHDFDDEAGSGHAAGVRGRHGEPARGVMHGHAVAIVFGLGRVRVNERRKREERNATAGD
jgi:hypothetical protein